MIIKEHRCLKIQPRPTDYRHGDGHINLKGMPLFPSGNSLVDFLFYEPQKLNEGDTNGCAVFTPQKIIDALWEVQTQLGLISSQTTAWADSLGFMDVGTDGKKHFHSSEDYLQIRTGNGLNGNNLPDALDAAKKYGLLPYKDLPIDKTLTPQQYVNPSRITSAMTAKAQLFLAGVGGKKFLLYQWTNDGVADPAKRIAALPYGPLAIGVNVGPDWNEVTPPAPVSGQNPGHAVAEFAETNTGSDIAWIHDNYLPNPKQLINWDIRYALQIFLTVNPPPPAPLPPPNPTPMQTISWLSQVVNWLRNIISSITPEGKARMQGASRSPQWPEVERAFVKLNPTCKVCGTEKDRQVHHVKVFHLNPDQELNPANLITLCRNHHLLFGHFMDWASWNKDVRKDANDMNVRINQRPMK